MVKYYHLKISTRQYNAELGVKLIQILTAVDPVKLFSAISEHTVPSVTARGGEGVCLTQDTCLAH